MKSIVDKMRIIGLKEHGHSNRWIAKEIGCDRKTVARYWRKYSEEKAKLSAPVEDIKELQQEMCSAPQYDSSGRKRRKLTDAILSRLEEILKEEARKDRRLGAHKQQLTKKQIHEQLVCEGYDISLSSINTEINRLRKSHPECFIRQEYELGDRLEYDFGEVKLEIGGKVRTYHMAVMSSPAGDYRWCYLYTNQRKEVFLESHVAFFEKLGGCYKEVVYDNMRNVVSRFIGRNEKELNEDLVKLALYYGFSINVTNCFRGNEKGYVESSVKILRNRIFAGRYQFLTLEDAREYMESRLEVMNRNSRIEEEKQTLLSWKPPLELAQISENEVNSYSFISVDNNFYSVPEYLVGKKVTVKKYAMEIVIYASSVKVCTHRRMEGQRQMQVDIFHYLDTLYKKPGAIRNSLALKSIPALKEIYDLHYCTRPRQFIDLLRKHKDLPLEELLEMFRGKGVSKVEMLALGMVKIGVHPQQITHNQLLKYSALVGKAGEVT